MYVGNFFLEFVAYITLRADFPLQHPLAPHPPTINRYTCSVDMARGATGQEHHRACEIFRAAQAAVGIQLCHRFFAAVFRDEARGHLGGEEAWRDTVAEDVSWAEIDGEVAGEVDHGGCGTNRVRVRFGWAGVV